LGYRTKQARPPNQKTKEPTDQKTKEPTAWLSRNATKYLPNSACLPFMLTSTVVAPNALNLKMPGRSDTPAQPSTKNLDDVRISNDGSFYLNNRRIDVSALESKLAAKAGSRSKLTVLISPDKKAPVEGVVTIMDMARRLNIDGVLAASE
jgi:biopolymer transport protein ExbD